MRSKQDAIDIFKAGVEAVQPEKLLATNITVNNESIFICGKELKKNSFDNIIVIGAGKAAAAMAVETEKILGQLIHEGLVVTKYGHSLPSQKIKIIEAAHPVPDENSIRAVKQTLTLLEKVGPSDIVICLISGGASALWCDISEGISLSGFQLLADGLVNSGATIQEINIVRKHFSVFKGGQLIKYCNGAKVFSLMISDVPGDDPGIIGSGPTSPDPSYFADAKNILIKYGLYHSLTQSLKQHIDNGVDGIIEETPKPGNSIFSDAVNIICGTNKVALDAAGAFAKQLGYELYIDPVILTGDTIEQAKKTIATAIAWPGNKPACLIRGGETTLKINGKGKGGRNQHFVLIALEEMLKAENENHINHISLLSGGSDGTDGPTDAAGAFFTSEIINDIKERGISTDDFIKNFDSYPFFKQISGLLVTGPTQTNVMDIIITLINPDAE